MKALKTIGILLLLLFVLFSGLVVLCAFRPDFTDAIAEFLYPDREKAIMLTLAEDNDDAGWEGDGQAAGATEVVKAAEIEDMDLIENANSEYIPPNQTDVLIPESVSGRNGYQRIQDESEQIEDDAARSLENQLDVGYTGDGLIFDAVFYPYYGMLDEKGRHLYRQIYANADALNQTFAPVEEVLAPQLRNVFAAVYNDHPELFWLETAYYCKYKRNGQCVEIDLSFNRTAQNLDSEKTIFNENATSILSQAYNLGSDYEKEKFVHDMLLERISYNLRAEMNQSAYSALVNGQTVCAGYARAFQYLLQQLGIPCYYCTGYAGENHAWNIVSLEDGYYNVDVTWDDTEGGNYVYFNRTDQDYADTHVREELAIYLPPCNGQNYRNLEQTEGQIQTPERELRSLADVGMSEADILYSLSDYYDYCYNQIAAMGWGEYQFSCVIEGETLSQELNTIYQTEGYRQGYMENAMEAISASSCEMNLRMEELEQNRYLVTHEIHMR